MTGILNVLCALNKVRDSFLFIIIVLNKRVAMKSILLIIAIIAISPVLAQQSPCTTNPLYRQFDFWVGEWEVFNTKGSKAGDSKISIILDSCILLEEWSSVRSPTGVEYKGKSFNTYNTSSGHWQQTWVDNAGGTIEFLQGKYEDKKMQFLSRDFNFTKDTVALRKLTFFNISKENVRQLGEISKDNGLTWAVEYDLDYRSKK
jgi:hypothetical protein